MHSIAFQNAEISICPTNVSGHYLIESTYRGERIKIITTDREAFEHFYCKDQPGKQKDAWRRCLRAIKKASNTLMNAM